MTVYIAHQAFSGPYDSPQRLADRSGLYAILSNPGRAQLIHCLDQSANIRGAVSTRLQSEPAAARGGLAFAAMYTPGIQAEARKKMVAELRARINLE